jgi:HNH endonuclease
MASEEIPQNHPIVTRAEARAAGSKFYFTGKECPRGHVVLRRVSSGSCTECSTLWKREHYNQKERTPALKAARAAGLKVYETGKPCPRGHIAPRYVSTRRCTKCTEEDSKSAEAKQYQKEWYQEHREETIARSQARHKNNRAACLAAARKRRENATEETKLRDRAHKEKHFRKNKIKIYKRRREKLKIDPEAKARDSAAKRRYADNNREIINFKHRERYKNDPERRKSKQKWVKEHPEVVRELARINAHVRRARKRKAKGRFDARDIECILKLQKGKCAICRKPLKNDISVDHIVPLSKGGMNWPNNLQVVHRRCNSEKSDIDPIEFMQRNGRLL